MTKADRRIQRTRKLLQHALIELLRQGEYDAITIQDIADRANLGRTTFYLHFNSKDELFISCHESIITEFYVERAQSFSKEELLSLEAPSGMISAYRHLEEARTLLHSIFQSRNGMHILAKLRESSAREIRSALCTAFPEAESAIPMDVLSSYLAGAQIALVQWWLEKRQPRELEDLAQIFHRLQRTAIRDAFGIKDSD